MDGRERKEWNKGRPEKDRVCYVQGSDYMGVFLMLARWVEYKNQPGKGRWMTMTKHGERPLSRKETPDLWRYATREQFMEYYGLGEDDMKNEIDLPG